MVPNSVIHYFFWQFWQFRGFLFKVYSRSVMFKQRIFTIQLYNYVRSLFVFSEEVNDSDESFEDNFVDKLQRKITPSTWEGVDVERVSRLPANGINGLKIYELNKQESNK